MPNKIYYSVRLTEKQLLNYLNQYRVYNPQEFDNKNDLVEITIAIYAKRYFEKNSKKSLFIAFETKEKIILNNIDLNKPEIVKNVLDKRSYDTLIDFMLVPADDSNIAYAFQIKRFFIKVTDKNIEELLAAKINEYLKLKTSQEIYLIIAPDKYLKSIQWPTKIDVSTLKKMVKSQNNSYIGIFVSLDNGFMKL